MDHLLIGNDTAVITLLLLFITGLLTKRFVPWWVHEEALRKLAVYEDAAPALIEEVKRLVSALEEKDQEEDYDEDVLQKENTQRDETHEQVKPQRTRNPKRILRRV